MLAGCEMELQAGAGGELWEPRYHSYLALGSATRRLAAANEAVKEAVRKKAEGLGLRAGGTRLFTLHIGGGGGGGGGGSGGFGGGCFVLGGAKDVSPAADLPMQLRRPAAEPAGPGSLPEELLRRCLA